MRNFKTIEVPGHGPEDTLMDGRGNLYTGLKNNGTVVRIDLETGKAETIAEVGGMPLGLDWLPDGRLLVCNGVLGLQAVEVSSGGVEKIDVKGIEFNLCNNAHVMPDGTLFVSESSRKYPLQQYSKDLIENTASGRLLKVETDGPPTVLIEGLSFANGVAYLEEIDTVLVAETGQARIHGVKPDGTDRHVFAETPGYPDNLSIGSDGNVWVAIPSTLNETLGKLHDMPLLVRKIASSLPTFMQPKPVLCCSVLVYDAEGKIVERFEGSASAYHTVTGAHERNGLVAIGSIEQTSIGIFETGT